VFFNIIFYVSHRAATRFLRNGEKYYIYCMDNLLLFLTANNFQNWLTVDKGIAKKFDTTFVFLRHNVQQ